MGIQITSVQDAIEDNGLKILIHGQAGAGKTVFCATGGAPTLIISAEAGLLSLKDAPDYIKTVRIESMKDLEEVYDGLSECDPMYDEFDWICLDSVSEIAEQILAFEKTQVKDARQAYGVLQDKMFKLLRLFRDLPNRNIVMTCKQERQTDDDTGITSYVPSLPGKKLTQGIAYLFDEVLAIRVEKDDDGENYHTLQCHKDRKYEAKDRSGELDEFEAPHLKTIAEKMLGGKPIKSFKETLKDAPKKIVGKSSQAKAEEKVAEKPAKETAKKTAKETAEENSGATIAEKDIYWVHHESDSYGIIEAGREYNPEDMAAQLAEIVGKDIYDEFKARVDAAEAGDNEGSAPQTEEAEEEIEEQPDPDEEIWVCVECEQEISSSDEPESCTRDGCDSTDFYQP